MVYVAYSHTDLDCLQLRLFIFFTDFPSHIFVLAHTVATHTRAHARTRARTYTRTHSQQIFGKYKSKMKMEKCM